VPGVRVCFAVWLVSKRRPINRRCIRRRRRKSSSWLQLRSRPPRVAHSLSRVQPLNRNPDAVDYTAVVLLAELRDYDAKCIRFTNFRFY